MEHIIAAFYMTIELWVFAGVLLLALVVESVITARKGTDYLDTIKDNPTLR